MWDVRRIPNEILALIALTKIQHIKAARKTDKTMMGILEVRIIQNHELTKLTANILSNLKVFINNFQILEEKEALH